MAVWQMCHTCHMGKASIPIIGSLNINAINFHGINISPVYIHPVFVPGSWVIIQVTPTVAQKTVSMFPDFDIIAL